MSKYELVVIVDAQLSQADKDTLIGQVKKAVEKYEGKIINSDVWMEKQRFTFPMKNVWDGTYYILNLELKHNTIADLRRELTLNEKLLRTLLVKAQEPKASAKAA